MGNLIKKTASCLQMLEWFEANHQIVTSPRSADIIFFKYSTNSRRTNHVGLAYNVTSDNSFDTIEGNTSINSDDNGGSVMLRKRTRKNVVAIARPNLTEAQRQKILDIANGELGTKEYPPNSNNVKYNTWFYGRQVSGANYPWCAVFISYIFDLLEKGGINQGRPILRRGSSGTYVKLLQDILITKNYILKSDGEFGPITETYVKQFQKNNGLVPDGVVGQATWAALMK